MIKRCTSYEGLDPEVREVVRALNEIPFTSTHEEGFGTSCAGHLLGEISLYGIRTKPDNGYTFITGGHVCFYITKKDPRAKVFMDELETMVNQYSFANLSEVKLHYSMLIPFDSCQEVTFGFRDLIQRKTIKKSDTQWEKDKKRIQIKPEEGIKRKEEFNQMLHEFLEIATEYIT